MPSPQIKLSVIVPVYNEAENIEALVNEITSACQTLGDFEIIYVDDGSSDNSVEVLKTLQQSNAHLKYMQHKTNYGQSASLVTGIRAAQFPLIATLDGDGQNDPSDILKLIDALPNDAQKVVVFGNRAKRHDNAIRKLSSRIGNGVRQFLLKDDCTDTGCSLKLFPRDEFLKMPHFNHLHRFLPALFKRLGYQIKNIPVNHRERQFGVSKYGIGNRAWVGLVDCFGVRWLQKRPCDPECVHDVN